jgi:hypothetical protein
VGNKQGDALDHASTRRGGGGGGGGLIYREPGDRIRALGVGPFLLWRLQTPEAKKKTSVYLLYGVLCCKHTRPSGH